MQLNAIKQTIFLLFKIQNMSLIITKEKIFLDLHI